MAFNAGSFMEKIKASVQQIFDEFKVSMLEIVAEKGRGVAMVLVATMPAQPEVEAATVTYHQEAALEEQQKSETVKPNTMAARLFTAVELIGSMELNQRTMTAAACDYTVIDINKPHVYQICKKGELLGSDRKQCRRKALEPNSCAADCMKKNAYACTSIPDQSRRKSWR
jgi:hypothetical protein